MKKYIVDIRETLIASKEIEASSIDEAKALAKDMYDNGDIVLDEKDFTGDVDVRVLDSDCDVIEDWDNNYIR